MCLIFIYYDELGRGAGDLYTVNCITTMETNKARLFQPIGGQTDSG